MVVWKRFRLRKWSPFSAYTAAERQLPCIRGERKFKTRPKISPQWPAEKQWGASSKPQLDRARSNHMNTLESRIPQASYFWNETRNFAHVRRGRSAGSTAGCFPVISWTFLLNSGKNLDSVLLTFWDLSGAKVCRPCRSRQELSNEYLLAKIGVDTAENEPHKVWRKIQFTIH